MAETAPETPETPEATIVAAWFAFAAVYLDDDQPRRLADVDKMAECFVAGWRAAERHHRGEPEPPQGRARDGG